jgi:hypothetical protein
MKKPTLGNRSYEKKKKQNDNSGKPDDDQGDYRFEREGAGHDKFVGRQALQVTDVSAINNRRDQTPYRKNTLE